jgi:hypothetical protein
MLVYGGLNLQDVLLTDGSFSNRKGQHNCNIAEKILGRQQKMKGSEKKMARSLGGGYDRRRWVEMNNCGLKIDEFSACWTY